MKFWLLALWNLLRGKPTMYGVHLRADLDWITILNSPLIVCCHFEKASIRHSKTED